MSSQVSSGDRCTGQVKWFNNRAGYGFVTATSGDKEGEDIFAHHTMIEVDKEQYKYLVQGEYVEFSVVPTEEGVEHECQAGEIKGVNSGKLMCETRFDNRRPRRPRGTNDSEGGDDRVAESSESTEQEEQRDTNRRGGGGPRQGMRRGGRRPNNRAKKTQEQAEES